MRSIESMMAPSKPKPRIGTCNVCGRTDVRIKRGGRFAKHPAGRSGNPCKGSDKPAGIAPAAPTKISGVGKDALVIVDDPHLLPAANEGTKADMERASAMALAIQRFRNLDMLGKLTRLRGTPEYAALCEAWRAWNHAHPHDRFDCPCGHPAGLPREQCGGCNCADEEP